MTHGGLDLMKKTLSRTLTRPGFWAATAGQLFISTQIWVSLHVAFDPGTSFRDELWPAAVFFAVAITVSTLLSPLLERAILKDDARLSDEQAASLEWALRTGALPLATLFADWGPALEKRRRDLVFGQRLGPIFMAGLIALNVYDSSVDPDGLWFYWISAIVYAVLAVVGRVVGRRRIRRIGSLEQHLQELRGRVPSPR